jgi:uncharacterized protein (DUF305 family)
MKRTVLALGIPALALCLSGTAALAQHAGHNTAAAPGAPAPGTNAPATDTAPTSAFKAAAMRMHKNMDIPYTGNVDRDFATGMIAHHQGAIDMARIELEHGKDPMMRKLAQEVITAQEEEIAGLRAFLAQPH